LPVRGEIVPGPGLFEFEVLDADPRRVKRVRITRLKERRERPRESRATKTDSVSAGAASPVQGNEDSSASKDTGSATGASRS